MNPIQPKSLGAKVHNARGPSPARPGKAAAPKRLFSAAFVLAVAAAVAAATVWPSIPPGTAAGAPSATESLPRFGLAIPALSPNLSDFFQSFDENQNDGLEFGEARAFYEWVEKHVAYRYDDENATRTMAGAPVGDGRLGRDYQQTPEETLAERLGDCEDVSGLELAFYRHWGVPAYMVFVNAKSRETYDHALTIVLAAQTEEEMFARVGVVPYYASYGRPGIEDGLYLLVDNAYSNEFGAVTGELTAESFQVFEVGTFESVFGGGRWRPVLPSAQESA